MKAVQCKSFGSIDEVMSVEENVHVPKLNDEYKPKEKIHPLIRHAIKKDRETHMIIKASAVALAPGDYRVLSGKTREFQGPPSFPYIPGGDCCGIVTEVQSNEKYFKPGDLVAVRFSVAPRDALAEYARVSSTICEKVEKTQNLSPAGIAALASASPAVVIAEYIEKDERVLILGGGGGIGSHLCQLLKAKGCFVCGVSRNTKRLLEEPLNYDMAVDYTTEDVFHNKYFQDEPFDSIIDLACGGWLKIVDNCKDGIRPIVKPANQGGRYLTVAPEDPAFEGHSLLPMLYLFMVKPMIRFWWNRMFYRKKRPAFIYITDALPSNRSILTKTLQLAYDKNLIPVIDGPYPMTTKGVREAFHTLESRHPKGKVVIEINNVCHKQDSFIAEKKKV